MLLPHAQKQVKKYNKMRHENGDIDTLYAFVMSESGRIYDGACLESGMPQAVVCGERHAIANMVIDEGYKAKIKSIVIADPVPEVQRHSTTPCSKCRHLIKEFAGPRTEVICMQYIQVDSRGLNWKQVHGKMKSPLNWIFPKTEKFLAKDLYKHPYRPKKGLWD